MSGEDKHTVTLPGARLALVLHVPEGRRRVPCVVACHGLGASKDSDKYLLLGAELPAAGLALARFDFRGCGESSGDEEDTTIAVGHGVLGGHPDHLRTTPGDGPDVGVGQAV